MGKEIMYGIHFDYSTDREEWNFTDETLHSNVLNNDDDEVFSTKREKVNKYHILGKNSFCNPQTHFTILQS